MKSHILLIFIILIFTSCKNTTKENPTKKDVKNNIVAFNKLSNKELDTIVKTSNTFKINGIECIWKHYIINEEVRFILKDFKTNQTLIDTDYILNYISESDTSSTYFKTVNEKCFVDLNFDGFKDFTCESRGSNGAMSNIVIIYIFNNKTKTFNESEEIYGNEILKIDKIKRSLILSHEWRHGQDSTIIYFNKLGKIKYTEVYSGYSSIIDTTTWVYNIYIKTINGKKVKEKRDSIQY